MSRIKKYKNKARLQIVLEQDDKDEIVDHVIEHHQGCDISQFVLTAINEKRQRDIDNKKNQ